MKTIFLVLIYAGLFVPITAAQQSTGKIDRHALVTRHNVSVQRFDSLSSLSVGNGEFAFTVDPTGLQTFPEYFASQKATPLCTEAQWGWHTTPMPDNLK